MNAAQENRNPVAQYDSVSYQGSSDNVTFDIQNFLGNDYDPDGDELTIISVEPLITGEGYAFLGDNSITLYIEGFYLGYSEFEYVVSDGKGGLATGTITFWYEYIYEYQRNVSVMEDKKIILGTYNEREYGQGDTVEVLEYPMHGKISYEMHSGGMTYDVVYTPDLNFFGTDSALLRSCSFLTFAPT